MANALVDNNGHWSHEIEVELEDKCDLDRFPKLISPRDEQSFSSKYISELISWL